MSPVPYAQNVQRHARAHEEEARLSGRISRARLTTFLLGASLATWTMWRGATPEWIVAAVACFVVFGGLVAWHARVEERMQWHDAHGLVNRRALARLSRDWNGLPSADPPQGLDLSDHPYALDLDLFGRASLFQWLGPAATVGGSATLASWLLTPAARPEIVERQQAIAHLATLDDWRIDLAAHGVLAAGARDAEIERFLDWAEGEHVFGSYARPLEILTLVLTAVIVLAIAAQITGLVSVALWPIPMLLGVVLWGAMVKALVLTLDRAGIGQEALSRYAGVFAHAVTLQPASPRLAALLRALTADGQSAPIQMERLNRILGFGELRRGAALFHFFIQAITLWDFHVVFALERWRAGSGARVRGWLKALAELDALALLATARRDNPTWAVPEIAAPASRDTAGPVIAADALGHPLIPDDRRVVNDAAIGPRGTVLLITGSNMSGKSTLLRAIGLNVVLAQAGANVCASRMTLPESDLETSLRVQDSLERGLSYFMAALARLKGVVDAAEHEREGRVLVYLLDEILQGTNSVERAIAVRAIARHLLEAGAIGALTTHDLGLAEEEPLKSTGQLFHFSETLDAGGSMSFDYKLKPGLATSRNALRLMKMIGIDL